MTKPFETPPFVVLEGLDGAGTTTQTAQLATRLEALGQPVDISCEPSTGPVGVLIRKMLCLEVGIEEADEAGEVELRPVGRETLALLFAADRLHHLEAIIEPALRAGKVAISDRYYHSSLVYQGDVDDSDQVDYGWVRKINERARVPDLTIFLEAPVELCLQRMAGREAREIYETRAKLERLEKRYSEVMGFLGDEGQPIVCLDASRSVEDLAEEILKEVLALRR